MKKKLISIALLVVFASLLLSATAFADSIYEDKDEAKLVPGGIYQYEDEDGNVIYQQKISTTFDFVEGNIAYKIVGDNQVEVSDWSWRWVPDTHGNTGFISSEYSNRNQLEIPATVTHESTTYAVVGIGKGAFVYVTGTQVVLPESITYFGSEAFCEFKDTGSLVIPASVTRIDYNCFEKCSLTSITFAEGSQLKSIGKDAFKDCTGLSRVVLPEGVEELGESLFSGLSCPVTIPGSVTNFSAPVLGSYTGNPVENITFTEGPANFIVQDGVIYAYGALIKVYDSTRTEITVPEGIEIIGASAFGACTDLETLHLPDSIRTIGDKAFMNLTKLKTITGLENVTSVGRMTFKSCTSLTSVDLANVTEIPESSFQGCTSLTSVSAPNVVSIGGHAFSGCSALASVYMPSVEEIGSSAFEGSGLTDVVGFDNLKAIGMKAFMNCPLTKVVLPETLESVGIAAFAYTLGDGSDLSVLVMQGATPPEMNATAFQGAPETLTVIVPEGSETAYGKTALGSFIGGTEGNPAITFSLGLTPASLNLIGNGSDTIAVTATIPAGYKLVMSNSNGNVAGAKLSDDGGYITVTAKSAGSATISVSIVSDDDSITLVTKSCNVVVGASYTVTIVYGNGAADGIVYIAQGESYKLPAAPSKSGYSFIGWRGDDGSIHKANEWVPISADATFTAVWQAINIPDPNGITVTQPANGTIKVNPSNGSAGTLITVTATPDKGYELAYITVDGERITGNTFRMPDKAVTVSAVFVPVTFPFTDVHTGDWYYDYVAYVYSNGLMDGTSATTFEPNANMTRAMVWAILARIDGETVTGDAWATDARTWAMNSGVSDGTDPNGLVTREQFATMLYRYAVAKGYDVSIGESTNILSYADYDEISEWAIPAMQWACGSGIITGVTESTLVPQGTATRAQCAAMLMRFVEL